MDEEREVAMRTALRLHRDFAEEASEHLWPWEEARWFEFVFCVLVVAGEPEIPAVEARRLVASLSELGLIEVARLADPEHEGNLRRTLGAILVNAGYTESEAEDAVGAIYAAALNLQERYGGKIQKLLRRFGDALLPEAISELGLSGSENGSLTAALWLQNTLNMPIPAPSPIALEACSRLGVEYQALVEAAENADMNVALVDDSLRAYWEREVEEDVQ